MRLHGIFKQLAPLRRMTLVILVAGTACDPDSPNPPDGSEARAATRDSLSSRRTELVSDLQKRVLFLLSTSPNAPTAGVFTGGDGDSTLSISIANDTNHIAPRIVLDNPSLIAQLRSVGYRTVSFRDDVGRTIVVPLPDAGMPDAYPVAPAGVAGELARRAFADSVAARLRSVGADARARGAEREVLYFDGLRGSPEIALGYANAIAGGMVSIERVRALRFTGIIVAGPTAVWCWNLSEITGPVACSNAEIRTFR